MAERVRMFACLSFSWGVCFGFSLLITFESVGFAWVGILRVVIRDEPDVLILGVRKMVLGVVVVACVVCAAWANVLIKVVVPVLLPVNIWVVVGVPPLEGAPRVRRGSVRRLVGRVFRIRISGVFFCWIACASFLKSNLAVL